MSANHPSSPKTTSQQRIPQGLSNLQPPKPLKLDEKTAIDVISQLLDPKNRVIKINGDYIGRKRCERKLIEFLKNPILRGLLPHGFKPEISELTPEVLDELKVTIKSYQKLKEGAKKEEVKKEKITQLKSDCPNVPILLINQWRYELEQYKILQQKAAEKDPSIASLNIEEQIRIIQMHKDGAYGIAKTILQKQGALKNWSEEETQHVLESIAEKVAQEPFKTTPDNLEEVLKKSAEGDYLIALALTKEAEPLLKTALAKHLSSEKNQQAAEGIVRARESIDKIAILTAPSHQELNGLVTSAFDFRGRKADKKSKNFLARLEKNWPQTPNPTSREIREAIKNSLGVKELIALQKLGISEEKVAQMLSIPSRGYFQIDRAKKPFSKKTLKLAQKLGLDPTALALWLNKIPLEEIKKRKEEARGLNRAILGDWEIKATRFNEAFGNLLPSRQKQLSRLRKITLKTSFYKRLPKGLQIILKAKKLKPIKHAFNFWVKPVKRIRAKIAKPFLSRGRRLLRKGGLLRKLATTSKGKALSAIFIARGAFLKRLALF